MWGRMWCSGGGGDPERDRWVRADGVRKCTARRWTNQGLKPPSSLLRRETKEYDHRHGRTTSSAAGSSFAAGGSSGAALLAVKEWADESKDHELVAVKHEPKEIARRGVVGPEDYIGDDVDAVAAAIAGRSLHEEAEHRRHDEELEDLLFKQAVAANLAAKGKDDEWRRIDEEQRENVKDNTNIKCHHRELLE
ncbi:ABC transporter B family member 25 [Hordeum vulgare]|nr:ABC transporter B family member 25 [Hordeum vulgare]